MKQLRLRSGKRAEEVAAELGVAMSTVRNWEQLKTVPRMTPVHMQQVMAVYGCTFDELVQAEIERQGRRANA
jgi:transcriptional regulator with XRE-family HTH domain